MRMIPPCGLALMAAAPAGAQVFDMGSLTATLAIDAVTQSERARAKGGEDPAATVAADDDALREKTRKNCTEALPALRAHYGSAHAQIVIITDICRKMKFIE